jgi:hypothetical protein
MFDSAGSMASQMRCVAMLEKVARDSKKAERWVAAEIRGGAEGMSKFQVGQLQLSSSMRLRGAGRVPPNQHHYNRLSPSR